MSDHEVIKEYLISFRAEIDQKLKNIKPELENIDRNVKAIKWEGFVFLGKLLFDLTKQVVEFGVEATKAMAKYIEKVVEADLQTQIFARRMLISVQNARSLQSVMNAMGVKNLDQLKDVALNPTLRKQFMSLRQFSRGLEPGENMEQGIGNFRDVGFQLQKISVLMSYFGNYVVGILGQMFSGPLKQVSQLISDFASRFKNNISGYANKVAGWLTYIGAYIIEIVGIFKNLFDIIRPWHFDLWFKVILDVINLALIFVRDSMPTARQSATVAGGLKTGASEIIKHPGNALQNIHGYGFSKIFGGFMHGMGWGPAVNYSEGNTDPWWGKSPVAEGYAYLNKLTQAQATLESGPPGHRSGLATKYHNLFGIKANKGWHGAVTPLLRTSEYNSKGKLVPAWAHFRAYNNDNESYADHIKFLHENSRYKHVFEEKTFEGQARAIQNAGYAGIHNKHYANDLMNVGKSINVSININNYGGTVDHQAIATSVGNRIRETLITRNLQGAFA